MLLVSALLLPLRHCHRGPHRGWRALRVERDVGAGIDGSVQVVRCRISGGYYL